MQHHLSPDLLSGLASALSTQIGKWDPNNMINSFNTEFFTISFDYFQNTKEDERIDI